MFNLLAMIGLFCCFLYSYFLILNYCISPLPVSYEFIIKHYSQMMRPSLEINWIVILKFDSVLNSYGYTQKKFIVCEILVYYIIHNNVLAITQFFCIFYPSIFRPPNKEKAIDTFIICF